MTYDGAVEAVRQPSRRTTAVAASRYGRIKSSTKYDCDLQVSLLDGGLVLFQQRAHFSTDKQTVIQCQANSKLAF